MHAVVKKDTVMKGKIVIYIAMALGIALGYFPLNAMLFKAETAQAQCMRYFLSASSSTAAGATCNVTGSQRSGNPVRCNPGVGQYHIGRRYMALCVGP